MYHTIEVGDVGVTVVAERNRVWVAATLAGACAAAEGLRHGPVLAEDHHPPELVLDSPDAWRPVYMRHPRFDMRREGGCWLWLALIVNRVRLNAGRDWPARWVAKRLADRVRDHLAVKYRFG